MATESNNPSNQEIDLSYLSKKTAKFLGNLGTLFFRFLQFLFKNKFILLGLIIVGAILGFFIDKSQGIRYKHEIIVVPNFNSTTYLYNKVEGMEYKNTPIKEVTVEPIVDVYQFITSGWNNLEIAKYLSQNNIDFEKYKPKSDIENFYRYHLMTIYTKGPDKDGKIVDSLFKVLNSDKYFLERQKIEVKNIDIKISQLNSSINYTNKILERLGSNEIKSVGDVNVETYSNLNELINTKNSLVKELETIDIEKLEKQKIIYDSSRLLNVKDMEFPMVVSIPIAFIVLYMILSLFVQFFIAQSKKIKGKNQQQ